ncbi:MAG: hypothetical protein K9J37_21325 [Saprospiraceae bacterium]|nr:hypothetical protein [Saprospiraceae bacterium]MCF8252463.1 hypothetical protein [Saprospiraceae bacterium]MCF8282330.1 hypothetical protein [Bacteroidales bacterium]MCF8314050.1 hypothetical protein [Saprospiraceae bacterium]MCF8442788.1 hypothetical protein [Saprospiraceae bacterium]
MEQIIFKKTGNFWIDNGLVALADILNGIEGLVDVELNSAHLAITDSEREEPSDDIKPLALVNQAKERATQRYLLETQNAGWYYAGGNFYVYRKTDFNMALKPFFKGKTPNTEGALCTPFSKKATLEILRSANIAFSLKGKEEAIELTEKKSLDRKPLVPPLSKSEKDAGSKGRFMTKDEFIKFLDFLSSNSPVKIGSKSVKLDSKGFLNSKPQYAIGQEFTMEHLQSGKKLCSFSGEIMKSTSSATGMDFPFLTGSSGEVNFASFLSTKPQISAKYAFVATFSFYNLRYLLQNDFASYFILYDPDLDSLRKFYNRIRTKAEVLADPMAQYCNFENVIIGVQYEAESLISFVISIYLQLKGGIRNDEMLTKTIYTFGNDGNIFRDVKEYTKIATLFEFFKHLHEAERWNTFLNLLRFFQERKGTNKNGTPKFDTTWRNRLCDKILSFSPIATTIEQYLGGVRLRDGGGIPFLDSIIFIYNQTTQFMKEEIVKKCKGVGDLIGQYCKISKDKGILFSIRNARNRTDFLKTLSLAQFKMADDKEFPDDQKQWISWHLSEEFFVSIPEDDLWEEHKALVSIFAMNRFLYDPEKKAAQPSTTNN